MPDAYDTKLAAKPVKQVVAEFADHLTDHGFVTVTNWANGEGFDIQTQDHTLPITHGEWHAAKKAAKLLMKD